MTKEFTMLLAKHSSIIYGAILLGVLLYLWYSTIALPYWWDSAGYVIPSAWNILQQHFHTLISLNTDFAHPPLFVLILALAWQFFGASLLVSHVINLCFVVLCLLYTYKLGTIFLRDNKQLGRLLGFGSALLLLFTPVFLAQVGIIYTEIPTTAFAVMAYYYFLQDKRGKYALAASLMVLTKETSVVLILLLFFSEIVYLCYKKTSLPTMARITSMHLIPLLLLSAWFVYHFSQTNWWLFAPTRQFNPFSFLQLLLPLTFMYLSQYRFLFLLGPIALLVVLVNQKETLPLLRRYWDHKNSLILLIPAVFSVAFSLTEYLDRYSNIVLPFFYLSMLYCTYIFLRFIKTTKQYIYGLLLTSMVICSGLFVSGWNLHRPITTWYLSPMEDNLEYQELISLQQRIAQDLQRNGPHIRVYASFPFNVILPYPYEPYVSRPITTIDCTNYHKGDRADFIILHWLSPGEAQCMQLATTLGFKHFARYQLDYKEMVVASK